jgi:hypothetical protein
MLCKIIKGSIRWSGRTRHIGDTIDISAEDYRRVRKLVEKVANIKPDTTLKPILTAQMPSEILGQNEVQTFEPSQGQMEVLGQNEVQTFEPSQGQMEVLGQNEVQTFVPDAKTETKLKNIKGAKK